MDSRRGRKPQKRKRHIVRNLLITLVSIIVVLGLILFGLVMLERHMVASKTDAIVSKIVPAVTETTGESGSGSSTGSESGTAALENATSNLTTATPAQIAKKLNANSVEIAEASQGLISSARATSTDTGVTYNVQTSKLNSAAVNALLLTNGDQAQTIADSVLAAMQKSGVSNPKLTVNLTDASGKTIKTLTYSK